MPPQQPPANKKPDWVRWGLAALSLLLFLALLGNLATPDTQTASSQAAASPATVTVTVTSPAPTPAAKTVTETAPAPEPAPSSEPSPEPEPEPAPEPEPEPDLSSGQQNALDKAAEYLDISSFSKSGLIQQLEFEGFSNSDAIWAVNFLGVDWNQQAAKKAEEYLSFSSFSKSGLIQQLEFEGFTAEQARFGADAAY